jgi:tetratricopeptide (TPR) repeat protein
MSLLMDALKRAEKARQAEASSDGAELDLAATQGFSLDPIDESGSGERPLPREPTLDQPVSPSDSSGSLALEDTQAVHGRLGIDEDGAASVQDTGGRSLDDSISIVDDEEAVDVRHTIPSDTSATLPSLKQAQRSVDNYFDGTGSASLTRDDLQAAMSDAEATAPHQRVAGDTETQRRVRAVFHAKEASRSRRGRNWVVVGLVPLLLLAVVGGLVFLYWDSLQGLISDKPGFVQTQRPAPPTTQPPPRQPAAQVAPAVVPPAQQASAGTTAAGTPTPATAPSTGGGSTASVPTEGAPATAKTPVTTDTTAERQPTMSEVARAAPSAAQVTKRAGGSGQGEPVAVDSSGRRLSAEEYVAQKIQSAGLAPASPTGGTAFKIKRRTKPDRLHPRLARAYEAWRAGNLAEAKRDYERVLKSDPHNRDALLGLGAIAVRNGLWDEASARYTALLRLNPRDSVAQAGLIAVHENADPLRGESQIKLLLREEPEAPHLHFTLGNMYAEQGRWGEAQTAYFDAYRRDSDNPDYTYNLAVSLDQLGKSDAAADYYRRALELAADNGAGFDQPSVRDRLLKLAFEDAAQ